MSIQAFINSVIALHQNGETTEHSFRSRIENLIAGVSEELTVINEPRRIACGSPDLVVSLGNIAIGHIEAKDIGIDLREKKGANAEQRARYTAALPNLIYTNCLEWDFYREGQLVASVRIADYLMGIQPLAKNFETLEHLLLDFIAQRPQTITSPKVLAKMMAGKASLIKDVLGKALSADQEEQTELTAQYLAFKEHLIHDIEIPDFADIYAETIAYGMFAARLHDDTPRDFSRVEALDLLPKSNPFLRSLFSYIAGPDLDDRISWIIDELADIFQACDLGELMKGFGSFTQRKDPFIHFYEDFLQAYNPKKRKSRGVWYTPEPVVSFIVRAVDEVLQSEFGLPDGLADTSKVTIDWDTGQSGPKGKRLSEKKSVHRVQILDPATGTGTFLAEVIKQIAPRIKGVAEGLWSSYIEQDLIPRLHGFELLMASYAMCHMKLDMTLTELGYQPTGAPPRLGVYLTNSLEEGEPANQTLPFAQWLSNEVKAASAVKRDMPIMCVIGNPPYSVSSSNKSPWIENLVADYKKDLNEKNIQPLSDDYVKFIRFAHHLITKNGEGVLGFITNNSYLDGLIHRRMRAELLENFDKIYVLDLHGSTKKKETSPDGGADKNVFDIQQGVSIIIAVKKQTTAPKKALAEVFHADLWGARKHKYAELEALRTSQGAFEKLRTPAPHHFFVPKNFEALKVYDKGFSVNNFMPLNSSGIKTHRDHLVIDMDSERLQKRIVDFYDEKLPDQFVAEKFGLKDNRDWKIQRARAIESYSQAYINEIYYRPFDHRFIYYNPSVIDFDRFNLMRHMIVGDNVGLSIGRQGQVVGSMPWNLISIQDSISDFNIFYRGGCVSFPLYLYPEEEAAQGDAFAATCRQPNFDGKLIRQFAKAAGLEFIPDHEDPRAGEAGSFHPLDVFDYIYAVLHCPAYRETYKEFLKIDFPRIPWPRSAETFWDLALKGAALRRLHLMEPGAIGETPYPFLGEGEPLVEKVQYSDDGKVFISNTHHFADVPPIAWDFYIGGYQPAQKWLKDRKVRVLSFEDIRHYQRIIKVLSETDRIMNTIEMGF